MTPSMHATVAHRLLTNHHTPLVLQCWVLMMCLVALVLVAGGVWKMTSTWEVRVTFHTPPALKTSKQTFHARQAVPTAEPAARAQQQEGAGHRSGACIDYETHHAPPRTAAPHQMASFHQPNDSTHPLQPPCVLVSRALSSTGACCVLQAPSPGPPPSLTMYTP
jgi:hypothetical protein